MLVHSWCRGSREEFLPFLRATGSSTDRETLMASQDEKLEKMKPLGTNAGEERSQGTVDTWPVLPATATAAAVRMEEIQREKGVKAMAVTLERARRLSVER